MEAAPIHFYLCSGAFGFMSNFFGSPITDDEGRQTATVEHWFQAMKFDYAGGEARVRAILAAATPAEAKRLGNRRSKLTPLRRDWEDVKRDVMLHALRMKFSQHPRLRAQLLATGDRELVEHSPPRGQRGHDTFWADGGDGAGANVLGQCLMETRERFRA
jgi:N-glycosidase YbiA